MTKLKLKKKTHDSFWGALIIITLSTLPYFHDLITTSIGLKPWVPSLGVQEFLTDSNGKILGFSSYRVFLYTLLIFVFALAGWRGWYSSARHKFYEKALLLSILSALYQIGLIVFNLRRTVWNESVPKLLLISLLFIILGFISFKKYGFKLRNVSYWLALSLVATLPFYHDIITERGTGLRNWVPKFGLETILTNKEGLVHGFLSYRTLVYFFCIHLFAHLGWIGWFMDSRGKRFRSFLLIPVAQTLYQLIIITMSWQETRLNDVDIKLYITLGLSILLAINFFYNNKISKKTGLLTNKEQTTQL